jgi:RAQPRD family integrative conjugative element protein
MASFAAPRATSQVPRYLKGMTRLALLAASAAVLLVGGSPARADEDAQREALARIAYELARLEQLAGDAAKQQEANARTRFRFDWLGRDLALVRRGIEDHLDAPRQPRPVPPLRGDYRP